MNAYQVWHAGDRDIRFFVTDIGKDLVRRGDMSRYQHVADVNASNLDEVYEKTNSYEYHWSENAGVTALLPKERSTSVGDVLICSERKWMVDSVGFLEL